MIVTLFMRDRNLLVICWRPFADGDGRSIFDSQFIVMEAMASEVIDDCFESRWHSGSFHFECFLHERKDAARRNQEHRDSDDGHVGVPFRLHDRGLVAVDAR